MKIRNQGTKKVSIILCLLFAVICITGCDTMSASLIDITKNTEEGISRSCSYLTGNNIRTIEVTEDKLQIDFITNIEEGSISFAVIDSEGNEICQFIKEEAGTDLKDTATVPDAGNYTISTTGTKFKGNYEIKWKNG